MEWIKANIDLLANIIFYGGLLVDAFALFAIVNLILAICKDKQEKKAK
jgi:hypothetical protein